MPSPYNVKSIEGGYEFATDFGLTYQIFFLDCSSLFQDLPLNSEFAFSFSFSFAILNNSPEEKIPLDSKVELTIAEVIKTFFERNDRLILYTCDDSDGKESARDRKFNHWFIKNNTDHQLIKLDKKITVENKILYNTLIFKSNTPHSANIENSFHSLCEEFSKN